MPSVLLLGNHVAHAFVLRLPGVTAIVRPQHADRGDAHPDLIGPLGMREHGMRAEAAGARKPLIARRVIVEAAHRPPAAAIVIADEQPGLVDAGVMTVLPGAEGPDLIHLARAALGIGRTLFNLTPVLEVGAGLNRRAVDLAGRADEVASARAAARRRALPAFEERTFDRPAPPILPGTAQKCTLLGSDDHQHATHAFPSIDLFARTAHLSWSAQSSPSVRGRLSGRR